MVIPKDTAQHQILLSAKAGRIGLIPPVYECNDVVFPSAAKVVCCWHVNPIVEER
ncbi:hypothetical protein L914_18007, partial [Phytophthora nicotianae]